MALTAKAFQTLRSESATRSDVVRTEFVKYAPDSDGIRQEPRHLPHASVVVDSRKVSRVEKRVPVGHVFVCFFFLWFCFVFLGENPPGTEVMVVLVDMPQSIANLQMD